MKKTLLIGIMAAFVASGAAAQNHGITSTDLGEVNGVADNGKFAAVSDVDNSLAYI